MNRVTNIPDWKLERYRIGELPEEEISRLDQLVAGDEGLQGRLQELISSDDEIKSTYRASWMKKQINKKLTTPSEIRVARSRLMWLWPVAPILALLLVMAINPDILVDSLDVPKPNPTGIRLKGLQPTLQIFRKTDSGTVRLKDGGVVQAHDLLQIAYQSAGQKYGLIISVDGRGTVTTHLPYKGSQAHELEASGTVSLNFSYELDDAPVGERFYFITSSSPFEVDSLRQHALRYISEMGLESSESLTISENYNQMSVLLRKDGPDE